MLILAYKLHVQASKLH